MHRKLPQVPEVQLCKMQVVVLSKVTAVNLCSVSSLQNLAALMGKTGKAEETEVACDTCP